MTLIAHDNYLAVDVNYGVHQELIVPFGQSTCFERKVAMYKLLKAINDGVPKDFCELAAFPPIAAKASGDPVQFGFSASNGSDEVINGRLVLFRIVALGFVNLFL